MTKKLESLLNLPETKEAVAEAKRTITRNNVTRKKAPKADNSHRSPTDLQKIDTALPEVKGLGDAADKEFDELAQRATDAYDDLMDLGMNVEPRYAPRLFEIASSMLRNAIDAKNLKIEKKLKIIELQLKKHKLEQLPAPKHTPAEDNNAQGEGYIVTDRNSLLEKLRNMPADDK